jgi:hypothetical protein
MSVNASNQADFQGRLPGSPQIKSRFPLFSTEEMSLLDFEMPANPRQGPGYKRPSGANGPRHGYLSCRRINNAPHTERPLSGWSLGREGMR